MRVLCRRRLGPILSRRQATPEPRSRPPQGGPTGRISRCSAPGASAKGSAPCPRETVAAFLAAEANRSIKSSTIGRRLAAIRYAHKLAGYERPTNSEAVKATLRGIRRTAGSAPVRKAPATADKVLAMVGKAGTDIKGLRDRALLLLGFAGAFRRSELVALDVADLQFCDSGLRAIIRKSKTDQEGQGATIAIARGSVACPVDAVRAWIKAAGFLMVLYSALLRGRERSRLVGCQPEPSPSS